MSPALIFVAAILAIGIWGYLAHSDPLYLVNRLSAAQIAAYAQQAGFTGYDLSVAVAVAQAESGGDAQATGDAGVSVGLWQINTQAHPEFDRNSLRDPAYNASAAYQIYARAGGTFQDWSVFQNQSYLQFLS